MSGFGVPFLVALVGVLWVVQASILIGAGVDVPASVSVGAGGFVPASFSVCAGQIVPSSVSVGTGGRVRLSFWVGASRIVPALFLVGASGILMAASLVGAVGTLPVSLLVGVPVVFQIDPQIGPLNAVQHCSHRFPFLLPWLVVLAVGGSSPYQGMEMKWVSHCWQAVLMVRWYGVDWRHCGHPCQGNH